MLKIYGASDDLIEIEGDCHEEFNHYSDDNPLYLACSDGTLVRINYDGLWNIKIINCPGEYNLNQATDEDNDYSDILTLHNDIKWIVGGDQICQRKKNES